MRVPDWRRVAFASDCRECKCCGEPWCDVCDRHYADCECPGPNQEDEYEYREVGGVLEARPIPLAPPAKS